MSKRVIISSIVLGFILICGVLIWFLFFRGPTSPFPVQFGSFGTALNSVLPSSSTQTENTNTQTLGQSPTSTTKIFNISPGPVTSATFIQTFNPTTTVARFVTQQDGHVFDVPLDTGGAANPISVMTIPGSERVLWAQGGASMILQYLDNTETIKTVYVKFAASVGSTTLQAPADVEFFPDNIIDMAVSPDGNNIAYLLKNQSGGVDGYTALVNDTKPKDIFSIPLSHLLLSWPAPQILLLQTKSSADVPGIVFEVGAKNGSILPLIYGDGITAIANKDFSEVLYQTRANGTSNTYLHVLSSGGDTQLYTTSPERCVWDALTTNILYCANPIPYVDASYLDSWHQGILNYQDDILLLQVSPSITTTLATPGSSDGGAPADIAKLIVSPDDHYLMYITKGDRSLWGIRLTQ